MAGSVGGTRLDCPRCGTTYRLSGQRTERNATYECAKCHEVFGPGAEDDGLDSFKKLSTLQMMDHLSRDLTHWQQMIAERNEK